MLAMDCEMCKTDVEENALLGVCIVDQHCNIVFKVSVVASHTPPTSTRQPANSHPPAHTLPPTPPHSGVSHG